VSYALRRLLNHLPISLGMRSDKRLRTAHGRHAQFAGFLGESGARPLRADRHARGLRRRRAAKALLLAAAVGGSAWIVLESARAVVRF
jgi:ferric-dicitrate binding protein FerR (iron transport regulator)